MWRTFEETAKYSNQIKTKLGQRWIWVIQNTIQINEKATKKTLQQRKFKKYNSLKHYPNPAAKATDFQEDNANWV